MAASTGVTRLWGGGGADSNWTTANNWNPHALPHPGDDLIFPTAATRKANANDMATGTTFHSITIHGTGYTITGNQITLMEKLDFISANATHLWGAPLRLALPANGPPVQVSINGNIVVQLTADVKTGGRDLILHHAGGTGDLVMSGEITGYGNVSKTGQGKVTWLDTSSGRSDEARLMLAPAADDLLEIVEVSRKLNNSRNEGPDVQEIIGKMLI